MPYLSARTAPIPPHPDLADEAEEALAAAAKRDASEVRPRRAAITLLDSDF